MELSFKQLEPEPMVALAVGACCLLRSGAFAELAAQFGYAIALGRDPVRAIQEDLAASLAQLAENKLNPTSQPRVQVRYFISNNTSLFATAECLLQAEEGGRILVEFVISCVNDAAHATLEQISAAA